MPPQTSHQTPIDWHRQELLLLREVVKLVGKSLTPDVVIREMLHLMSELLGLNRGRLVLRHPEAGPHAASIRHAYGLTTEQVQLGHYMLNEGITGKVLATGQPVIVQDVDAEPAFLFRTVSRAELPQDTVSFLALPVLVSGEVRGVFACHRIRSRQRHLNDDLSILSVLATLCGQMLQLDEMVREKTETLEAQNALLSHALESQTTRFGIVGHSAKLLRSLGELERVAPSNATVLLLGESGTGKELFARALHLLSPRLEAPFVRVNCAAIPDTLFESELFGHEKGAFTGAQAARPGLFEQAQGGTIFLDEIGELPLPLQSKLLRALQENMITRLGGKHEIALDVRVVAATNIELGTEAAAGRFRQDLYYRLNVIPIRLPPLRERPDDIPPLILHLLNRANQSHQRNVFLDPAVMERLQRHPWPGNIRELGNLIERLVLLAPEPRVDLESLSALWPDAAGSPPAGNSRSATPSTPAGVVRGYHAADTLDAGVLTEALKIHGNQSRAAQSLGLTLRQFSYRLKKLGIRTLR